MGRYSAFLVAGMFVFASLLSADIVTIDFEGVPDSTPIRDLYQSVFGVTFAQATAVTAGVGLNELEFPPHSGDTAVFDNAGPIEVDFSSPAFYISGYFTYIEPLKLQAFDSVGTEVFGDEPFFNQRCTVR